MSWLKKGLVLAAPLLVFALLAGACGSDSKGDNGGSSGGSSSSSSGGSVKTSTPEQYADAVCSATAKYAAKLEKLSNLDTENMSFSDMMKAYGEVASAMEGMSKDLAKITPPDDAKDFHNAMVKVMGSLSKAMNDASKAKNEADASEALSSMFSDMSDLIDASSNLPSEYTDALSSNDKCSTFNNFTGF